MFIFSRSLVTKAIMVAMLLMAMLAFFTLRLQAETLPDNFKLICEFPDPSENGYSRGGVQNWISRKQSHVFWGLDVEIRYSTYLFHDKNGKVTSRNNKKIEWFYDGLMQTDRIKDLKFSQSFIYYVTTGKLATKLHLPRYRDSDYVWGECKQVVIRTGD